MTADRGGSPHHVAGRTDEPERLHWDVSLLMLRCGADSGGNVVAISVGLLYALDGHGKKRPARSTSLEKLRRLGYGEEGGPPQGYRLMGPITAAQRALVIGWRWTVHLRGGEKWRTCPDRQRETGGFEVVGHFCCPAVLGEARWVSQRHRLDRWSLLATTTSPCLAAPGHGGQSRAKQQADRCGRGRLHPVKHRRTNAVVPPACGIGGVAAGPRFQRPGTIGQRSDPNIRSQILRADGWQLRLHACRQCATAGPPSRREAASTLRL